MIDESDAIALDSAAPPCRPSANSTGRTLQVVEVPPGPPVQAPIVAEIYGPFYDAQQALARELRVLFDL